MILDSQARLEFWGEAINTAVYLHQCLPNEGLTKRDDRDRYKAPYETPYEMLHSYGKPEYDKPPDNPTRMKISYKAPLHHLCRFGCYISRLIPEKQRTDKKLGARSKACMMVGYVHNSTTLWRIWDPEHNTVKAQSDVIFDEDRNAYISCPQSLKRKNSSETKQPEETTEEITEIDLFDLPQEEIHIEEIDTVLSGTDESMDHSRTRSMSGTEECMSHGRTKEARPIDDGNPMARANPDLSLTGHTNNGHEHRRPPDTGEKDGHHIYTHIAPDENADKYTEGQSGHCPILESHTQVPRDEVITNRNTRRQLHQVAAATKKTTKKEKKAPVPTDRVTRSAGRERVNITELMNTALALTTINDDPRTYKEAMLSPQKNKWEAVIMDEYNSIIRNETFSLAQAQFGNKPIGSKWVFKTKRKPDGSTRYKARLVIKGYEQMDYGETYAPVGKLTTFQLLISLAARKKWKIDHLDVVMAFLNPDVDDDTLFMELPEGWPEHGPEEVTVVRLRKPLYGLKQAPHLWYRHINAFLLSLGFIESEANPNLYIRNLGEMLPLLYIDDMLLAYAPTAAKEAEEIKQALAATYTITNLGTACQFLGIEIHYDTDGLISLGQRVFIDSVLKQFHTEAAHGAATPLDDKVKLDLAEEEEDGEVDPKTYQAIVGSLMYIALATRPDISFAVAALSRYNLRPFARHLTAAQCVLRYLKVTKDYHLRYNSSTTGPNTLIGYTDSE